MTRRYNRIMDGETKLRIAQIVPSTEAEGPGRRFAIWFQGCPLRCPGCCNPEMLSFSDGESHTVSDLLNRIRKADDIEGITLLGGEPFAHADGAADLARSVREHGLSVMVFSGYTLDELKANTNPDVGNLLGSTDILVDGPYVRELPDTRRRWIGSTNQRVHFLTDRYRSDDPCWFKPNTLEIRVDRSGITVNGFPTANANVLGRGWARRSLPRVTQ